MVNAEKHVFFLDMLRAEGMQSGVVYASGLLKARDVNRMAAECRAQETIRQMTARILAENEKAAGQGDLIGKENGFALIIQEVGASV